MRRRFADLRIALLGPALASGLGCPSKESSTGRPPPSPVSSPGSVNPADDPAGAVPLRFRAQPIPFRYERGETGSAWPVEVTGGGVGILDHDGDGDLDLFFAQGGPLRAGAGQAPLADVLLRNEGGGRFVDASESAGLAPKGYGQGVAVADYDADGDPDVYVTRYGRNTLWRNDGGRFVDATAEAGVGCEAWSLGAAFLDYDGDGDLDLFVANYFGFDPADAPFGRTPEGKADYSMPASFPGLPDVLYRNEGGGRFVDVTYAAGLAGSGRGMGCVAADFDRDGRVDVLVANDAEANALWRNRGDGTFEDVASAFGIDLNAQGQSEANMGIAFGDTDGDGLRDAIITHFFGEHDTLWRGKPLPDGGVFYQDETFQAGLGAASRPFTGWGVTLSDFDLDGRLDLLVTNGHIRREPTQTYAYENPPILWSNLGGGRFADVTSTAGPYFRSLWMGRGLAAGDLDGDGDLDAVVVHHHAPSAILWNESPRRGHWLALDLKGAGKNPDAIGAVVIVEAGGNRLVRGVDGGSYLSASDRRVHVGLGPAEKADRVEVRWPSGLIEARAPMAADRVVRWAEGKAAAAAE